MIVPVHNRLDHFQQTMGAFLNHTRPDVSTQFIVVNDNCDGAVDIIDGLTFDVEHYHLYRNGSGWRNPSYPLNVGIRHAKGWATVICHSGIVPPHEGIYDLYDHIEADPMGVHLARVTERNIEVSGSQRPYMLFGGMRTAALKYLRGYDEDFKEYGYEDDDLAFRLNLLGYTFRHYPEITANHIPHERHELNAEMERMRQLHYHKMSQMMRGEISLIRNLNRDWGAY